MRVASLLIFLILHQTCSSLASDSNSNQYDFVLSTLNEKNSSVHYHSRAKRNSQTSTITKYHISSNITYRWNTAAVESTIRNDADKQQEISIKLAIPEEAFISAFSMEIGGEIHHGVVKERETARSQYEASRKRGAPAGLVSASTSVRDSQIFELEVSVAAQSSVSYKLVYQELLRRKNGYYTLVIRALPKEIVADYKVDVIISEPLKFKQMIEVILPDGSRNNLDVKGSGSQAQATYTPTEDQQRTTLQDHADGAFRVSYDVQHEVNGELLVRNGYYIYNYVPDEWPTIPKHIVFVIDRSGSMRGIKSKQTNLAMQAILDALQSNDRFAIICFDSGVSHVFGGSSVQLHAVTDSTIGLAKTFVEDALDSPRGGTYIWSALQRGINTLDSTSNSAAANGRPASMIVLLTDGHPSSRDGTASEIKSRAKSGINGRHALFCIGFGNDVDHTFLKTLAEENQGVSRKIYQASDGAIQLKNFYDEIALPALTSIGYDTTTVGDAAKFVGDSSALSYNKGMNSVSVGKFPEQSGLPGASSSNQGSTRAFTTTGNSINGPVEISAKPQSIPVGFQIDDNFDLERLWAYLTIKSSLQKVNSRTGTEKEDANAKALQMSLKYKFVTPVTSMVVTDQTNTPLDVKHGQQNMPRFPNNGMDKMPGGSSGTRSLHSQPSSATPAPPSILPVTERAFIAATVAPDGDSPTWTAVSEVVRHVTAERTFILDSNKKSQTISTRQGAYPPNARIGWKFQLRDGVRKYSYLQFKLERLDVEIEPHCSRDRIIVYGDLENGQFVSAKLLCGFHTDQAYIKANMLYGWKNIYVMFESNDFITGNGFSAKVEAKIPRFCWYGRCYYGN